MAKLLDENGLAYFWGKVKAAIPTKTSQLTNDSSYITADSPALTGVPTAPTAAVGTDSTQIATTAFVKTAIGEGGSVESITNAEIDSVFPIETVSWADGTDEQIIAMVAAADAGKINLADYWAVGDERLFTLPEISPGYTYSQPEQTVTLVLLNAGGKTLANGTVCNFIVGFKDCLQNKLTMNILTGNSGGWEASWCRSWCNNDFKTVMVSTGIGSIFKQHQNISSNGAASTTLNTSIDWFALAADKEVFGDEANGTMDGEVLENNALNQFAYYADAAHRIKQTAGVNDSWWERSTYSKIIPGFNFVYPDGTHNYSGDSGEYAYYDYQSTMSKGISPFGCI